MISEADYTSRDATALAELVRGREVSPRELLDTAIARIERLNPRFNAVVETLYDSARRDIANGLPDGPFAGVPFLVKDLHTLVEGSRLSHGCRFFANHVSSHDSSVVAKARKAGLVIAGRTNTPEFGLNSTTEGRFLGAARNPWNPDHTTGGSSGGSAAAVASGMVALSHATDSGGSIRIPASCCGLIGLKPTRGRVLAGLDTGEGWHDTFNAFAITRSVRDTARLLDCLKNSGDAAPYYAPYHDMSFSQIPDAPARPLRIGILETPPNGVAVDPEVRNALDDTRKLLEDLGHVTGTTKLAYETRPAAEAFLKVICSSVASTVDHCEKQTGIAARAEDFEASVWSALQIGRQMSGGELNAAIACIHLTGSEILRQLACHDVVLSPTVAKPPLPLGQLDAGEADIKTFLAKVFAFAPFTSFYNISGQPAISLPVAWSPEGLPVGMQFSASPGREDILIRLAAQLEAAVEWSKPQAALMSRLAGQ
ncbi:amidase [Hoeflea sp. AS16]|uniref:amidase n=1 Tax=Hoeflea sp. AS16 TaxID=3135779 RepID=UPI00317D4213